jgi:hypothetical protein
MPVDFASLHTKAIFLNPAFLREMVRSRKSANETSSSVEIQVWDKMAYGGSVSPSKYFSFKVWTLIRRMVLRLRGSYGCQRNRRAGLAIDYSTDWACVSRASGVLGMFVMITSALQRGMYHLSSSEVLSVGSWQAWHDNERASSYNGII